MSTPSIKGERERDPEREYLVKAAMLVKIHEQVTWPEIPRPKQKLLGKNMENQVNICVIGKNPFPPKAQEVFKLASSENTRYSMMVSDKLKRQFCHIIFVADDKAGEVDEILQKLESTPTLTVSDIPGFASRGGGIEFFLYANKVIRMLVNEQSALEKGLFYRKGMYNDNIIRFIRKRH